MEHKQTKICSKCPELGEQSIDNFYKNKTSKDGIKSQCKLCYKKWRDATQYGKKHYLDNKEKYIKSAKARGLKVVEENAKLIAKYLIENPCYMCGENDIIVLEFHHLNNKEYGISQLLWARWEKIEKEINKCIVLCCNCHRRVTSKELKYKRYTISAEMGTG